MGKPNLVVVGNGMAGVRCVEELCAIAPDAYDITIFGSEPRPNYNRILLSKVLQGDASLDDIVTHGWEWYEKRGIRLHAGEEVVRIDPEARTVATASGFAKAYDRLLLATGSSAFIPPLPGVGKPGVIGFRSVDDCERMMEAARAYRKAAVIGGGLLGLEAARGLLNLGMEVTVVHNAPYLMNRQLDQMSAELLRAELTRQGMRFLFGKTTARIAGRKRAEGIAFADGTKLQADLIVMAVGIRPNVALAKSGGIWTNRAFVVDDYLRTNVPDIYAVGECAEHRGIVYGLVAPLYEQGKVLAKVLGGRETEPYRGSVPFAQLKVSGVDLFSAGDTNDPEATVALQQYDGINGTYKKVTARDGRVAGAILYGNIGESNSLLGLLRQGADVSALVRGEARQAEEGGAEDVGSIPDHEIVCQCNGVSKGAIAEVVLEGGLKTVEQVRDRTKASGSCGGCKRAVSAVVKFAMNGGVRERREEPAICGCAKLSHPALKEALAGATYTDVPQAMRALGWIRPDGCSVCRAAIRYYMGAPVDPLPETGDVVSVMPKLFAGVVRADQLRRIADVLDKFALPYGRLTGEGRLVLPGVRRRQAEAVARELGLSNESAEGAGHFAKVFVVAGDRGGEDVAVRLGKELERRLFRIPMPGPVTIAIAAGRSTSERSGWLTRELGLFAAPAGWEIYVGGHAERPVRQAQLLAVVPNEEEALEVAVSCFQGYREAAVFGESLWRWLDRTGLVALREKLLDPDVREEWLNRWHKDRHAPDEKSERRVVHGG
ncbi:nitrite reductase large subunit NirB [Paenibacillaceae bacterium WGS1546]|uniref:nitrite reductase large subunit NirB n=1 Tax=Cohnella sp. WGS1546 TaxID=3366810 RepID=UPI00372D8617